MHADCLVHDAAEVITCAGPAPRRGPAQGQVSAIAEGVVASDAGRIVYVGDEPGWARTGTLRPAATTIDASGGTVLPGFVDPHTHVVFAGDRRHELRRRLAGESYAALAASGGGIRGTVAATRTASEAELVAATRTRLDEMLRCGTTTCEAKSGYGLTTESELKLLRTIATLDAAHPVDVEPTFLGAHDVPDEYRSRADAYTDLIVGEMIPAVAEAGTARWCDVFCEKGVFTPEQSRRILKAGRAAGWGLRIHADELGATGGSQLAAELGVRSADHLVFADDAAIEALATARVCATLLPIATLYLKLPRFARARAMVDAGIPVALATDVNPGGGFSPSMPFAMTLACFAMNLTFEEALIGATLNAAWSLAVDDRAGSLEPGKQMDAIVVDGPAIDLIRVGTNAVRTVVKKGRVVHAR